MPQKYKISYTYANITAKMLHFSAKMPHFLVLITSEQVSFH